MDHSAAILQIAEQLLSTYLWKAIFLFIVTFVIGNIIKQSATTILDYILLKTDVFGIGSLVYYSGRKYKIKRITLRRIEMIDLDRDENIFIHIHDWKKLIMVIPTSNPPKRSN